MKQQPTRPGPDRYPDAPPPRRRELDPIGLATLVGIVALLMITFSNMHDVERLYRTHAMGAALASEAARSQGKFWPFHDKLFANQDKLAVDDLKKYAKEIALDMPRFEKDLVNLDLKKHVTDDMADAKSLGITGTPAF